MTKALCIALPAILLIMTACTRLDFERAHDQSLAENPLGVELRIEATDGKSKFRVAEAVEITQLYAAKYPGEWHMEILDGGNPASMSDEAHISDGKSTSTIRLLNFGIVCCDSRHVWLSLDPVVVPYKFSTWRAPSRVLHLPKPGKYEIYVTTRRVFNRDQTMGTTSGLGFAVTAANILKIEVVP